MADKWFECNQVGCVSSICFITDMLQSEGMYLTPSYAKRNAACGISATWIIAVVHDCCVAPLCSIELHLAV